MMERIKILFYKLKNDYYFYKLQATIKFNMWKRDNPYFHYLFILFILFISLIIFFYLYFNPIYTEIYTDIGNGNTSNYNPGLDKNNPDNMIQYTYNNKYYVSSYNENDPHNPYRRSEQIYKIKSLIDHIQGIKRYRDISKGWVWDDRHNQVIPARTPDSDAQDSYLQDIWDNVDTYTTIQLITTLKDLETLWRHL